MPWTPPPGGVEAEQRYKPGCGGLVIVPAQGRPEEGLAQSGHAPRDVAADVIGVCLLRLCRRLGRPGQDEIPKSRRKTFDLRLDPLGHVHCRSRRARGSRPTGFDCPQEHVHGRRRRAGRRGRRAAPAWRPAATSDSLVATSSSVPPTWTVPAAAASGSFPGDWATERPVDLAYTGAISETPQRLLERGAQPVRTEGARGGEARCRRARPWPRAVRSSCSTHRSS